MKAVQDVNGICLFGNIDHTLLPLNLDANFISPSAYRRHGFEIAWHGTYLNLPQLKPSRFLCGLWKTG